MAILKRLAIILAMFWAMAATAAGQDLRIVQTAHYRIHTDLDEELVDDLGQRMDAMYAEYSHRLADLNLEDDPTPLEVYLVHTRERYLHFAGLTLAGTGGSFNASRHLLAAYLDGQGRDALRRTLQHEALHQFVFRAIGRNIPIWVNEGLAQVFEEGIWTGDRFLLGQVPPWRLRQLRQDINQGKLLTFPTLLAMTPQQWAANWHDPARSIIQYNQSWAMVHFLVYADDGFKHPKYRDRFVQMLRLLHAGVDGQSAFAQAFSPNIQGFHDRFMEYVATLQPTPMATLIETQGVLADILVSMRQHGQWFDTFDQFRDACVAGHWRVEYLRGNVRWQSADDPSIYFSQVNAQEHFELAGSRPLPDLVYQTEGQPTLRTRFWDNGPRIEHETIVEPATPLSDSQ